MSSKFLFITLLTLLVVSFTAATGRAQSLRFPVRFELHPLDLSDTKPYDTSLLRYPNLGGSFLRDSVERETAHIAFLTARADRFYGLRRIELTRGDFAMQGAGAGATLGLFTGAVAGMTGMWDEDTSWYLVGAAAALGAILGATAGTPKDPKLRVRYRWED